MHELQDANECSIQLSSLILLETTNFKVQLKDYIILFLVLLIILVYIKYIHQE